MSILCKLIGPSGDLVGCGALADDLERGVAGLASVARQNAHPSVAQIGSRMPGPRTASFTAIPALDGNR